MYQRIITFILFLLLSYAHSMADYENPSSLPDPMRSRPPGFVCDPDAFLTRQQTAALNAGLMNMMKSSSVQMAVVVVNSIGDADPVEYAVEVGTLWGVGQSSNSNGVILLIVMDSHDIALQAGYGMEGVLTDVVCKYIIEQRIVPMMRNNNLYGAIEAAMQSVASIIQNDPQIAEQIRGYDNRMAEKAKKNRETLLLAATVACALIFIGSFVYMIVIWRRSRSFKADWYSRSRLWRKTLPVTLGLGILSAGAGLIFFLLALWRYRYWRTRTRKCHRCGARMHRLGEEEDNAYLDSAQDTEEKLGTVDYDVWLCEECGEVERYPYYSQQTKYTACPHCGAIAYATEYERVKVPPTTRSEGVGERVKRCHHCGYTHSDDFRLPRRQDGEGALLAAGIAASALGRGGSGGGSFGGWGGGSFGGGGASGKW